MVVRLMMVVLLGAVLAACGDDDSGGTTAESEIVRELRGVGLDRYLGQIAPAQTVRNGDWDEHIFDPLQELAVCLDGSPFQVNVRRGTSERVILYLEGGGACWNADNCSAAGSTAKRSANSAPASDPGFLDTDNPENPFADWNVVYASYCDGSVWGGENQVDYGDGTVYHHGLQNVTAAIDVLLREFPAPEQLVLAGSSAGGYGTYTAYGVLRIAMPDQPIWLFNDSGPGVEDPDDPAARQARSDNWRYRERIAASCERCDEQIAFLTSWALDRDDALRVALFNYLQDAVLQFFFGIDDQAVDSLLRDVSGDVHSTHPDRMRRFLINGTSHTALSSADFYATALDGTTVAAWTAAFLADDPSWIDLADVPFD
jgi:hypothetical protein